jgi:c-di-GMP-binding flagellar brake protein YcgR
VTTAERRRDSRKQLPNDFSVVLRPQDLYDGGPSLVGRAADLTMGGIGIILPEALDPALQSEVWTVSFTVSDKSGRVVDLSLNALITHGRPHADGHFYGLKFHELKAPHKSVERAALRQFLLSDLRDRWQGNLMLQAPSM